MGLSIIGTNSVDPDFTWRIERSNKSSAALMFILHKLSLSVHLLENIIIFNAQDQMFACPNLQKKKGQTSSIARTYL